MGKLNLVVEDAPVKVSKNEDLYKEVVEAFNAIKIGQCVIVPNNQVPSLGLLAKIRSLVTLQNTEDLRISRMYGDDKKLSGLKLIKQVWKPKKAKTFIPKTPETPKTI